MWVVAKIKSKEQNIFKKNLIDKLGNNTKFDTNATMVFATEYGPENPHRKAGKRFYDENQWPDNLPGFREVVNDYMNSLTNLGKAMLPLWALALDLERDHFLQYFENNYTYFRMAHYPPVPELDKNEYGLGPHADTGFMTFLPQAEVDGLEILDVDGNWFRPPKMDNAILVNTGQFLERWSNKRFRKRSCYSDRRSRREYYCNRQKSIRIRKFKNKN